MTFFRWSFLLHKVWQCRFDAAVVPWFKWPDRDKTLRHRRRRWRGRWRQHNIRATNYRKKNNSRTLRQQTVYFAMILFSARSLSLSWWTPMSCLMCANDTHTQTDYQDLPRVSVFFIAWWAEAYRNHRRTPYISRQTTEGLKPWLQEGSGPVALASPTLSDWSRRVWHGTLLQRLSEDVESM